MKRIVISMLSMFVVLAVAHNVSFVGTDGQHTPPASIELPADFDYDAAQIELKQARKQGDTQRARRLSQMIHQYWLEHREVLPDPALNGTSTNPVPEHRGEDQGSSGPAPLWGDDVRMDPNDGVQQVQIASTSWGELYGIALREDGSDDWLLVKRSTDNGATWTTYAENNFGTSYDMSSPGIFISNDTIIMSYILERASDGYHIVFFRACVPGPTDSCVSFGSPTGYYDATCEYLSVCTDGVIYDDHYTYATWVENYMPDSTRLMVATSQDIDFTNWEIAPAVIQVTNTGAQMGKTSIAYGSSSDALWIAAGAHPVSYPSIFDEFIVGYISTNWGSSWSDDSLITPLNNDLDEYEPAIAGAHNNTNWVVLHTTADTSTHANRDIDNTYSTDDGETWTSTGWIGSYENFAADVWVDNGSTGFFGACRQDRTGGVEHIRYKDCPIADPTAWTVSVLINDDVGGALSNVYGPSVTYNEGTADESCVAWNGFVADYSIWFDTYSDVAVEERNDAAQAMKIHLAPNPSENMARLSYTLANDGAVLITLYDATGRLVKNLMNETQSAGDYAFVLNNGELSAGVYFVRIETPDTQLNIPMTIVR